MFVPWRTVAEGGGLVLALSFVFLMAFLPHLNTSDSPPAPGEHPLVRLGMTVGDAFDGERRVYPYPIHVDEYVHWIYSQAILTQGKVALDHDPYTGDPYPPGAFFTLKDAVHERGFRLIVAEIQAITGAPFLRVFEFLPAIWMTFTAFGIYALLRPHPAAVPAAAFVALIPTTLRFLGPGFLVPIGFVLAWIPAALILAEPAKRYAGGAALLGLVAVWAFFVHLIGGFAVLAFLALGGLLGGARDRRAAVTLLIVVGVPILWLYHTFAESARGELENEEFLPIDFTYFDNIGLVGLVVWALGASVYAMGRRDEKTMGLTALVSGSMAMFALIVVGVLLDWGKYATYARWHPPLFLAASAPLAFAVVKASSVVAAVLRRPFRGRALPRSAIAVVVLGVGLLFAGFLVAPGVDRHIDERYYRVMNDADWARYQFIAENVGPEYEVFLVHPWKAPVLVAVSGKYPHSVLHPGTPPLRGEDWANYVLTGGTREFFIMNDVSLVVASGKPPLPEFINLGHDGVWGLEPSIAEELAEIRAQERGLSQRMRWGPSSPRPPPGTRIPTEAREASGEG